MRLAKLAIAMLVIVWAISSLPGQAQRPPSKARKVYFQEGRSLTAELAKSSGDDLEVLTGASPPFPYTPSDGTTDAEWKTKMSDFVALVQVESRQPALTATQDFVNTAVRAKVVRVFKSSKNGAPAKDTSFAFIERGGEISVGSRKIRGVVPWANPLRSGGTYLLFAGVSPSGEVLVVPSDIYELRGRRLASMNSDRLDSIDANDSETTFALIQKFEHSSR